MQFMVFAYDGKDDGALERRMTARPIHFETVPKMKEEGTLINGGAILDDDGKMIGSIALYEFPDRAAFDAWYENEPYVTMGVWQDVTIHTVKLA